MVEVRLPHHALPPALLLLALVSCGLRRERVDQAPEIELRVLTSPSPPQVGPSRLTLELLDPSGIGLEGAQLQVRGDMTHPGMTPVQAIVGPGDHGRYPLTLEWSMPGDWVLTVDGRLADGRRLLRTIRLLVEPAPAGS